MKGLLIKIKPGHIIEGEGETIGVDSEGRRYSFWRSQGKMEVPIDLAIKVELERPQRFMIVDRTLASQFAGSDKIDVIEEQPPKELITPSPISIPPPISSVQPVKHTVLNGPEETITLAKLNKMTKDQLNDWAAKRDYNLNPFKLKREEMVEEIVKQIEQRTKKKVV